MNGKAAFLFHRNFLFFDIFDPDKSLLVQHGDQFSDLFPFSLDFHLYFSIPPVLYPAGQAQHLGNIHGPVAEAHALNPAGEDQVFSDVLFSKQISQLLSFIPACNEPGGHASMSIWRLLRGSNTPMLTSLLV